MLLVSIGRFPAFYVVLVPLQYVPTIPLLSTYVIDNCFILFKKERAHNVYVVKIQTMSQKCTLVILCFCICICSQNTNYVA